VQSQGVAEFLSRLRELKGFSKEGAVPNLGVFFEISRRKRPEMSGLGLGSFSGWLCNITKAKHAYGAAEKRACSALGVDDSETVTDPLEKKI